MRRHRFTPFSSSSIPESLPRNGVRSSVLPVKASCHRIGSNCLLRGASASRRRVASCSSRVSFVSFAGGVSNCAKRASIPCSPSVKRPAAAARRACSGLPFDSARKMSRVSASRRRVSTRTAASRSARSGRNSIQTTSRARTPSADSTRPRRSSRSSCVAYVFAASRFTASLTSEEKRAIDGESLPSYRSVATNVASYENVIVFVFTRNDDTVPPNVPESPLCGLNS